MRKVSAQLRNARLLDGSLCDLRIADGVLTSMQPQQSDDGSEQIELGGRAVTVALKDHHIHLYAAAAAAMSLDCSAPAITSREQLAQALAKVEPDAQGWIRGIGFHEAHCGEIQRQDLDAWRSDVPVRLQHASGRLWVFNSLAQERLGEDVPWTKQQQTQGHLLDQDAWLHQRLRRVARSAPPDLTALSQHLAGFGVVAVTDTTPSNDSTTLQALINARRSGDLLQRVQMMGQSSLNSLYRRSEQSGVSVGALKIHLLESALPEFDALCQQMEQAHTNGRPVAFHCVTRVELVFALAAVTCVGRVRGDRIEHAGVCPDDCLQQIQELGLWVVSQPVFVQQRGDRYLREVDAQDQPWLYRQQAFMQQGVDWAASSDAPYGDLNPWRGMLAAIRRRSDQGQVIGGAEALAFNQALAAYQGELASPGQPAVLRCGELADICVLNQDWEAIRADPSSTHAVLVLQRGEPIWRQVR